MRNTVNSIPVSPGWPDYDAALTRHGSRYEAHIYKGANHGFHNDTTPRYDEAAAKKPGSGRWIGSTKYPKVAA